MIKWLNEIAPIIPQLNELPVSLKTEQDQMLLEQFCLSLNDNIDQEPSQDVNQYVNLDMCSDELLASRQQPTATMANVESAFKVDQATMEQLSLAATANNDLYPSPVVIMTPQSQDPALGSYRTPSKSPMPVPTINGYPVSPGYVLESGVPDWPTPGSLPGQSLFPDLGATQSRSRSPSDSFATSFNGMPVTVPQQITPTMYNVPVGTAHAYPTPSAPPHTSFNADIQPDIKPVATFSREHRVEPSARTVPVIMPGHALKTQAMPGMTRMPLYPQPAIVGYRPIEVQRHVMLPQREVMYNHHNTSSGSGHRSPHQHGSTSAMPAPSRESSLQSARVAGTSINRQPSPQPKKYPECAVYRSSATANSMPGKPKAEPFNIQMQYIDDSDFINVNVDSITEQMGGLSVTGGGVRPSAPRPALPSQPTVTHQSSSMPEPHIHRIAEAGSAGARTPAWKTAVDYKTRQQHKALVEALLEKVSLLFHKQEVKASSSTPKKNASASHWQLLDSPNEYGSTQEVN
ncbi:hypothetical protein BDF19DRAFT_79138 [Syncephalis fuscata]|nr:hypothetical protein BDF19DRAFT_79138 [Syncephalis fuscata]